MRLAMLACWYPYKWLQSLLLRGIAIIMSSSTMSLYSQLDADQRAFVDLALQGHTMLLTGSAGVGKSYAIHALCEQLTVKQKKFRLCATTGIAAVHIGGTTLHHLLGCGMAHDSLEHIMRNAMRRPAIECDWSEMDVLIVDEVSMMSPRLVRLIDLYARQFRNTPDTVFGGLQIIFIGDFAQLPCIMTNTDRSRTEELAQRYGECERDNLKYTFCFQHRIWKQGVTHIVYLQRIHRQADAVFTGFLNRIRLAQCTHEDNTRFVALSQKVLPSQQCNSTTPLVRPVELRSRNFEVDEINCSELMRTEPNQSRHRVFDCATHITGTTTPALDRMFEQYFDNMKRNAMAQAQVRLAIGSQVMMVANVSIEQGLANGTCGIVTGFEPFVTMPDADRAGGPPIYRPLVRFGTNTESTPVGLWAWKMKQGFSIASYIQIPLRLAHAISIHKSQGASLDCVRVKLDNIFEYGQAYVALSRARSLDGLYVTGFQPKCIRIHPDVLEMYSKLAVHAARSGPVITLRPVHGTGRHVTAAAAAQH